MQPRIRLVLTLLFLASAVVLPVACGEDDSLGPSTSDTTPPPAVSDLVAEGTSDSTVSLSWTAVGDPCVEAVLGCRVAAYDIRYTTDPMTEQNFADANVIPYQSPSPSMPGYPNDHATASGLTRGERYYFAMKSLDNAGNWSAMSNVATTVTWELPPSLERELIIGWPDDNYEVSDFAVDSNLNLYVRAYRFQDDSAGQMWKFDASGVLIDTWGPFWSTRESNLEIDDLNNLYIPEPSQQRILVYSPDGENLGIIDCYPSDLAGPWDVAMNGYELYVSDRANARVVRLIYDAQTFSAQCTGFLEVWINESDRVAPVDIAIDSSNHLYVNNVWQTTFHQGVALPPDVVNFADVDFISEHVADLVPDQNSVYMLYARSGNWAIKRITSDGHLQWRLDGFYGGSGNLVALKVDSSGRLYALHTSGIRVFAS